MADSVHDDHAGKPPASSAAGDEQMKMSDGTHQVTKGIFEAFRRSSTIPTIGKKRRSEQYPERRAPAPTPETVDEDSDAPMTLADLRRQRAAKTAAKPKPRPARVDEDGGFDVTARSARRGTSKPQGGASLAAGALSAMRRKT